MIKIAICDDEEMICKKMIIIVQKYFEKINRAVWISDYRNGYELLNAHIRFDIIFLDIDMPKLNGIETAMKLRKWDVNSKIVYVTNYNTYIEKAFKVHTFDYIHKPVLAEKIYLVLDEIVYYLDNLFEKQTFAFKTTEGVITLALDEIYYFEYVLRRVIIHSSKGEYTTMYSLKEIYEKFEKYNFAYPHKSFIVNMLYIKLIKSFDIFMENGDCIPLAQKRAVEFKNVFNDFLQSTFDRI